MWGKNIKMNPKGRNLEVVNWSGCTSGRLLWTR